LASWRADLHPTDSGPDSAQDQQRQLNELRELIRRAPADTAWRDVAMTLGLSLPSVPRAVRSGLRGATDIGQLVCHDVHPITSCTVTQPETGEMWPHLVQAVVLASDPADVTFIVDTIRALSGNIPDWVWDRMACPRRLYCRLHRPASSPQLAISTWSPRPPRLPLLLSPPPSHLRRPPSPHTQQLLQPPSPQPPPPIPPATAATHSHSRPRSSWHPGPCRSPPTALSRDRTRFTVCVRAHRST
jgi:hypothetical protein